MKNPFKKQDNTGVTAALIIVGIAAGTVAYLYFSEHARAIREKLKQEAEEAKAHATDYLSDKAPKKKKHTTDLHDLTIIPEANA